jgi:hypothetical protein
MTTIIAESLWPGTSAEQVAKTWVEMKALPDWLTMVWVGAKSEVNLGGRGLVMYQCYKDKIDDSLAFIREDVARYLKIPGYSFSIDIWTEPEDALKMVGLA